MPRGSPYSADKSLHMVLLGGQSDRGLLEMAPESIFEISAGDAGGPVIALKHQEGLLLGPHCSAHVHPQLQVKTKKEV